MSSLDLRPKLGRPSGAKASRRFLLVCFFDPAGITTVYENIALWQAFSRYQIEILNLWPGRGGSGLVIPSTVNLNEYVGLIVHSTVSYFPVNLYALDTMLARPFEQYDGVKVLMKQDEHFHTRKFVDYIGEKKLDLVLTCVSPEEREKVYPREVVGEVDFLQVFTGYVSPFMQTLAAPPSAGRPIDISYRGSIQPLSFGRLGFEKRKIGYDVSRAAADYPLTVDISSRWADRIGGTAWFDFLGRSRAVLGVQSATNLFDFTGEVEAWCNEFETSYPEANRLSEEFYNRAHQEFLYRFEGNVNYAQISPRHFEAAATRSVQVLYEGDYSGVLVPHRHFIPLRRDFQNFREVVEAITDSKYAEEMAGRAFEEIIQNREFHYEAFVERFDAAVDRVLTNRGRNSPAFGIPVRRATKHRALLLAAHEPTIDPRIEWMACGLSNQFEVCEVGIHSDVEEHADPSCEQLSLSRSRVRVARRRHDWEIWLHSADQAKSSSYGLQQLLWFYVLAELPPELLQRAIGAHDMAEDDLGRFRWLLRYFLHTNSALVQTGRLIGEFDLIVATDLETLPAALILAEEYGAAVLYDAHEFWPHADMKFRHWEVEFWSTVERTLLAGTDLRVAVSPQLARLMSQEYGHEFVAVPNCVSKNSVKAIDLEAALQTQAAREHIVFLFLGVFAPGRGIEDLIRAWARVNEHARLVLQGPENEFKREMVDLARNLGLLDRAITFPDPVQTDELITAARQADVGIIPYAASSLNNRYCCPNKLSQYMAAGLPIVCNETEFVKSIVIENSLGYCVNFGDHAALVRTIDHLLASREEIPEISRRSQTFFRTRFNWEAVSGDLYARAVAAVRTKSTSPRSELDFSWIVQGKEMRSLSEEFENPGSIFPNAELKRANEIYSQEVARLNEHIMDQSDGYSGEIARLNRYINDQNGIYTAEIGRLNKIIIDRNDTFAAEIARLNDYIADQNEICATEIIRLNTHIVNQRDAYSAEIARLRKGAARGGGTLSAGVSLRCPRWRFGTQGRQLTEPVTRPVGRTKVARRLVVSPAARVLARSMIKCLPDETARRVKMRLVSLVDRL